MNNVYVYKHVHPETKEVMYVGHGTNERAYRCTSYKNARQVSLYGHRSQAHTDWCQNLITKGYVPGDWVEIVSRNLNKRDASKLEVKLINTIKPKFNQSIRNGNLRFTLELYDKAVSLRKKGLSYQKIASTLNLSAMTVHRGLSGKSISLETHIEERK